MSTPTTRIDAFADAAFAFAVSLMVVGTGGAAPDYKSLIAVIQTIPSFTIGFAMIAMFWISHVRWRRLRGDGDWRSVLLTLALILSVLIYIHPLRAMAASFAAFLGGGGDYYGGKLGEMFAIYGAGFVVMSLLMALLFRDALRRDDLSAEEAREAKGQSIIWTIIVATGIVSVLMTQIRGLAIFAPFAYSTLPLSIGIFVRRWQWSEPAKS